MCERRRDVLVKVKTPTDSDCKITHWAEKGIDKCIAPIVKALNDIGMYTEECCCGHGETEGYIRLYDKRVLIIKNYEEGYLIPEAARKELLEGGDEARSYQLGSLGIINPLGKQS